MSEVPAKPSVDEALALEHGLTKDEYEKIREHLGRVPTFEELGVFSVMWSEHCSYKSSRVHLSKFPTTGPRVLQGPGENAGGIDIGGDMAAIFKIESHNHPSYIEPYQGAATGVGGILRDIFTMGARPVAAMNSLRFGDARHERTPFLLGGVVAGIGGYGNSVGVPTIGGETYFDEGYNGNILVNAFTLGIVHKDRIFRARAAGTGNPVLYAGSKTGRDGIHGASLLASSELKDESEQMKPTVQVGDPFTENLLIEACLEVMQSDDVVAIQDMGAAGLTSSSVEMASRGGVGVRLNLDLVPLRDPSLTPYEMLLSESQERMVVVAKKGTEQGIIDIYERWGLDCVVIGEVTDDGKFTTDYRGETVTAIPVDSLTDAAPAYNRPIEPPSRSRFATDLDLDTLADVDDASEALLDLIGSPNLCSRRWIYEQYDSYVGANTLVHPGSDAAVIRVRETGGALAMTADCNSRYVGLDPFVGAQHAVAEAVRNLAATGARAAALSDCLNFGNPEKPEIMWEFSRAVEGMAEACEVFETPVISGNVSFYNDNQGDSIPPTPVVAMVGIAARSDRIAQAGIRRNGLKLYVVGEGSPELEASEYLWRRHKKRGEKPPALDLQAELRLADLLVELVEAGMVDTAHDVAEGGIAITLAEMCLAGPGIGCDIELLSDDRLDNTLFGEGAGRIVVAVEPSAVGGFEDTARQARVPVIRIGSTGGNRLSVRCGGDSLEMDVALDDLRERREAALPEIAAGRRSHD